MDDLIGKSFGPYRVVEKLGEGGMAVVYKAFQDSLGRYVAIKMLRSELARDEEFINRFRREALAAANLDHPNILHVYDAGAASGVYYMVMAFVDGGSLKDLIAQGPLNLDYAVTIGTQLADALDYAHRHGIIHRDVKPSNVLMTRDGRPMLTDFGIAKALYETAALTRTGATIGTPEYMAPEQIQGQPVDARTDIYALGIVLYEMLTGWAPFSTPTPVATLYKQVNEPPPPIHQVNVSVPAWIEDIVGRALAKRPEMRYQQASDLADALRQRRAPAVEVAPPPPVKEAGGGLIRKRGATPAPITPPPGRKATPPPITPPGRDAAPAREATPVPVPRAEAAPRKRGLAVPVLVGAITVVVIGLIVAAVLLASGGPVKKVAGNGPVTVVVTAPPVITQVVTSPPDAPAATVVVVVNNTADPKAATAAAEALAAGAAATLQAAMRETPSAVPPTDTKVPPTDTPQPPAPTRKPTAAPTRPRPTATKNTCPAWYQKPQPGKGVLLIENHMGNELQVEWIKGGSGKWMIGKKVGDVPGRLLLQLPPGDHEFEDQVPGWGGGVIRVKVEAGKAYISPIWNNSRREELVYPYDPPCK